LKVSRAFAAESGRESELARTALQSDNKVFLDRFFFALIFVFCYHSHTNNNNKNG